MQKHLARSDPQLTEPDTERYSTVNKIPQQRRPGKKPIDQELTRSQPDLHRDSPRQDNQVNRAPSFLRATGTGESDTESFQEVFDKEKTKRELAKDLENKIPNFYPNSAPPPYDYNGAPPAYTPSESDDYNNEHDEPFKGHIYNNDYIKPRYSDNSDYSNYGRAHKNPQYPPPPSNRGQAPERRSASHERSYPPQPEYAPKGRFSHPPEHTGDDEFLDDIDDMTGDMTLV